MTTNRQKVFLRAASHFFLKIVDPMSQKSEISGIVCSRSSTSLMPFNPRRPTKSGVHDDNECDEFNGPVSSRRTVLEIF